MISCSIAPDMAMEHEIESLSVKKKKKGENEQKKYTSLPQDVVLVFTCVSEIHLDTIC